MIDWAKAFFPDILTMLGRRQRENLRLSSDWWLQSWLPAGLHFDFPGLFLYQLKYPDNLDQ